MIKSFEQILKEHMVTELEPKKPLERPAYDVLNGVFAIDSTVYKFVPKNCHSSFYKKSAKTSFQPTIRFSTYKESIQPPDKKNRELTSTQLLAIEFFNKNGETHLSDNFTLDELKASFRQLAKKLHPDKHADASPTEKDKFQEKFILLKTCFDLLLEN